nr:hypothetical protein [Pirellula staleyi]
MIIFWKVRYLDRNSRKFGDRHLYLDTSTLEPAKRAAVELALETNEKRKFSTFRLLFKEDSSKEAMERWVETGCKSFFSPEYFEDELGAQVTVQQIGPILSGDPEVVMFPSHYRPHDIELEIAESAPIPIDSVALSDAEVRLLAYFSRDLREMTGSAFFKNGPGTLSSTGTSNQLFVGEPTLATAVTDDEIRSYVMIFRRLYMENEQANFLKAVAVYEQALKGHSFARWVAAEAKSYSDTLQTPPYFPPFAPNGPYPFTRKRLIDVFIYTQYAHQPKADRERQFAACLGAVGGRRAVLTWLFLKELQEVSFKVANAGRVIDAWFARYCQHQQIKPMVLTSIADHHPGLGTMEKASDKNERLKSEKIVQLANSMWQASGSPEGGPEMFLLRARESLEEAFKG